LPDSRFGVEVSTEEYWHLCEKAVATARETFLESRLFIPQDVVQKCERFLTSVVEAQINYAHARHPDTIDGHQRAELSDKARIEIADMAAHDLDVDGRPRWVANPFPATQGVSRLDCNHIAGGSQNAGEPQR
jgi:hypothetical protein